MIELKKKNQIYWGSVRYSVFEINSAFVFHNFKNYLVFGYFWKNNKKIINKYNHIKEKYNQLIFGWSNSI